jgi:hypothetical protein
MKSLSAAKAGQVRDAARLDLARWPCGEAYCSCRTRHRASRASDRRFSPPALIVGQILIWIWAHFGSVFKGWLRKALGLIGGSGDADGAKKS